MSSQIDANAELSLFELKEKAKWSGDVQEKKLAISGMLSHGALALSSLEEILAVSAYEDIRAACMDAIKSIRGSASISTPMELQMSGDLAPSTPDATTTSASSTKKKQKSQTEAGMVASGKLADLPP